MPLVQETRPTLSPTLHHSAPTAAKSEKALRRVRLETPTRKPSKSASAPKTTSPRSLKASLIDRKIGGGDKPSSKQRRRSVLNALRAGPTLVADVPSPSCWTYTGSPFHEQLREEYTKFWLPWRIWVRDSPPSLMTNNCLFLSERARAADWVEQMFESWFMAGYGYRKTHYEYPGMESD